MGQLGAPYGVKGWLKLQSFTQPARNILNYQHWSLKSRTSGWQAIEIETIKAHQRHFIAKITNIDNPEQAALLTNHFIGIPQQDLPPLAKGDYYWSELIGLQVINQNKQCLGIVDHLFETGANDVIVVQNEKKQVLIPYHHSVIHSVDLERKILTVEWYED